MASVQKLHNEILSMLREESRTNPMHGKLNGSYLGSDNELLDLSAVQRRKVISLWWEEKGQDIPLDVLIQLFNSLNKAPTYDERAVLGILLRKSKVLRDKIDINLLDGWLEQLEGWAQIDTLCQSTYSAKELLTNWKEWKALLIRLNKSANISKRRASLVLLVRPVRESGDDRIFQLGFSNVSTLAAEEDKLITKAISWLLREMTKSDKDKVRSFLKENQDDLPAIAVRETWRKIRTGKK
jgi:3-methyladenine DNA glycosylase AlkD